MAGAEKVKMRSTHQAETKVKFESVAGCQWGIITYHGEGTEKVEAW